MSKSQKVVRCILDVNTSKRLSANGSYYVDKKITENLVYKTNNVQPTYASCSFEEYSQINHNPIS